MSDPLSSLDAAVLFEHERFVRRLARRLVRDEASAEDVVQETWLAALERGPEDRAGLRAWLARVVRNRAALGHRRGERRLRRERASAREEPQPETAELVERVELHQRLVAAMLSLPEAQREVVLRRFFKDESMAAIAERLGVPEATARTRLRRGLSRLRERLRGELGSRPAYVAALGRLASDGAEGAGVDPTPAAPFALNATRWLPVLLMNKTILLGCLALVAVVLVWSILEERDGGPVDPVERASARVVGPPAPQAPEGLASLPPIARSDETARAEAVSELTRRDRSSGAPAAEQEPVSRPRERGRIAIRVVDRFGNAVANADVRAAGVRTAKNPGDWWPWPEEPSTDVTGPDGRAELGYPAFLSSSGGLHDVASVMFAVEHPEYVTYEHSGFSVEEAECLVVLRRGAFLVVSGYLDSPAQVVTDVVPHLSDEVEIEPDAWMPLRDGRPACDKLPSGRHALWLSLPERAGGPAFSEIRVFTLGEGEQEELHLQLFPPRTLRGELDPRVPRPVVDGRVQLHLYLGEDDGVGPWIARTYAAEVAADGTFVLDGLPPGAGEMIGVCRGWVSRQVAFEPDERDVAPVDAVSDLDPDEVLGLQQLDPARHLDEPFVLLMEQAASIEVTVVDPAGEPLPEASVWLSPNVLWTNGYTEVFCDGTWQTTSDARGVAVLDDLPPETHELLWALHADYRMPISPDELPGYERRWAWVELRSGETTRVTVQLEAKD